MGECSKNSVYYPPLYPNDLYYRDYKDLEELKNERINYYENIVNQYDNKYILDRLNLVKKDDFVVDYGGKLMNIEKYNRNITDYYNFNNPFLNQGQQVVISTKT